ncbi:hypothetical protein CDIF104451_03044 [Clostridioides difficile]|uniref:hypothetical protein n=1 Tax=Clostridioides difficile TaxID=1496 RepID=UPI000872DEBF|nr:hypothetical protein [Clostridioides difficile]NIZ86881.1 hypothetical protein [Clostridioides difficile]OFA30451.1 hypothetical protein BM72_10870 [Clostridioides difficile]UWN46989.1 hypothetical protein CDIF104451_03044 [Clostridioides difficile]SJR06935.1 Uncharacterised protein [Clostridioides difficile]VFD04503.1 Uncharacterised protein [Clostridioides difficile]
MATSMNNFNLPDMRKYTKNIAFDPFAGGRQSFDWGGNNHGLQGSSKDTCLSCTYNGSTINWGSGNVWVLGGYGQYTFTYNCESMHVDTQQKFPYTSNRIITIKGRPVISGSDTSLGNKRKGFSVDFTVSDDTPDVNLIVRVYLDDKLIQNITPVVQNSTLTATVTDSQLNSLSIDGNHKLKIQLNDGYDNFDRIFTFKKIEKGINISTSLVTDSQAKFTVTKTYSELTKIEWYLDEVLKDTFTTDLYSEKTINYELTDNAIHTLRIVATDAENIVEEKVISISKNIMPLQPNASLSDISTKLTEIGQGVRNGKTSIINTLALKNIEASLNNTLVELSEKIKTSFDSSDASVQDLMNQLTQANNTISQLNSKYKYASGTIDVVKNSSLMANLYGESFGRQPGTWLKIDNLGFIPNIFVAECQYVTSNNYFFKHIVIATCNINWLWEKKDFSARIVFTKEKNSNQDFSGSGIIYSNNERDVYINNKGINVPASSPNVSSYLHSWHAIKFI